MVASHRRVPLASIKSITLHSGKQTKGRRTSPIPQLKCLGKACGVYQPVAVQCTNMGDDGSGNMQWRCDADLPQGLRFGEIDVSCEGWDGPGDIFVLHGSCGLEYELVRVNTGLERGEDPSTGSTLERWSTNLFILVFLLMLLAIAYSFIRSIIRTIAPRWAPPALWPDHRGPGGPGGPGGGGGGGFPGWGPGSGGPPPPYSKDPPPGSQGGWSPGFWTGLGAGGAAAYLATRRNQEDTRRQRQGPVGEGLWGNMGVDTAPRYRQGARVDRSDTWDRGEGSSTGLRRATGFGGTTTR